MPGDEEAADRWRRDLEAAAQDSRRLGGAHMVVRCLDVAHRKLVCSTQALQRDGYKVLAAPPAEEGAPDQVYVGYRLEPLVDGIWDAGADFHWAYSHHILRTRLFRMTRLEISGDWLPGREEAFRHFEQGMALFMQGRFAHALRALDEAVKQHERTPGYRHGWRVLVLRGIVRLGFIPADLQLIDLNEAQECFVSATRYAEPEDKRVAASLFVMAAFVAKLRRHWGPAMMYTKRALELFEGFPEALFLKARLHMQMGEEDNAYTPLARAVGRDRGYAIRAASTREFTDKPDVLAEFIRDLQRELWERGQALVDDARQQIAFWRTRSPEVNRYEGVVVLDKYGDEGRDWRVYDLLQVLSERERIVERALSGARAHRTAVIKAVEGPPFEVEETYTVQEETQAPIIERPGGWKVRDPNFKPKLVTVAKKRLVTHYREAYRVTVGDGAGRPIAHLDLVVMPLGRFTMGSPEVEPGREPDELEHEVVLNQLYCISSLPVTQAFYSAVTGRNPSAFEGADRPVDGVTWEDAVSFCNALSRLAGLKEAYAIEEGMVSWKGLQTVGFRLPTEAEWEHACRAGTTSAFAFGHELRPDQANYGSRFDAQTTPAGTFPPNPWGLRDMHGNVWEWCWDPYTPYEDFAADPTGATGDPSLRVIRGGSWGSDPERCRSAARHKSQPSNSHNSVGFRLALSKA